MHHRLHFNCCDYIHSRDLSYGVGVGVGVGVAVRVLWAAEIPRT
jgi:hypothetical protein